MIAVNGAGALVLLALAFAWTILRHRRRELEAARERLDAERTVVRGPWSPRLVDERRVQASLHPRTGLVLVAPVDPPVPTRAQLLNEAFQRGDGMGAA